VGLAIVLLATLMKERPYALNAIFLAWNAKVAPKTPVLSVQPTATDKT